jgi:glycosyltransferase involved in cell wall biosynthesis
MPYNIRIVGTYPPRRCGIGTFSRDLASALEHFTGEVGNIRVAAIDKEGLPYSIPVDLIIDQYDPQSWRYAIEDILARATESTNPTVVLLQHEYGLDPNDGGEDGRGDNFVRMAQAFHEGGLMTLAYLHTVLEQPDEHRKRVLQELARYSQGLIVTTESAVGILESRTYGIDQSKLMHIDHGIRMRHPSQYDRLAIKADYGLQGLFLVTTLGLLSPGKGIEYGIRAYGKFVHQSLTASQRERIVYLIGGQCHPDFVRIDRGEQYRQYQTSLCAALEDAELQWCRVSELTNVDFRKHDVVFLDRFLDENILLKLYGATNVMVLPYLDMEQISSGVLADTVGSGRASISVQSGKTPDDGEAGPSKRLSDELEQQRVGAVAPHRICPRTEGDCNGQGYKVRPRAEVCLSERVIA